MKTKITYLLNRWDEHFRSIIVVAERGGVRLDIVRVEQSNDHFTGDDPGTPRVSWSSIGSVSRDTAMLMAGALIAADGIACDMALIVEWKRITPPEKGLRWTGEGRPEIYINSIAEVGKVQVSREGWTDAVEEPEENQP